MNKKKMAEAKSDYKEAKKTPVGSGKRFAAVEKAAKASGASDPGAVAAAIGRKKYGDKKFQAMASKGRK